MKKQVLVIALISLMTFSFTTLMAQNRPERGQKMEMADTLTPEQTLQVSSVLDLYDSQDISTDDATSIMKSLKEAKVPQGKGVENAFKNLGFDFDKIRKLAPKPERPEGGRPEGGRPRR